MRHKGFIVAITACVLAPCPRAASLPNFRAQILKPSMRDQVKLGVQAAAELRKDIKVVGDKDPRSQLVRRIGQALLDAMPEKERLEKPWQFTFDLVKDKQVNAFALPGGPCFVLTGLLEKLTTEDQLAGILAHEVTHVRKEHWARDYAKSQETSLGILVIGTIFNVNRNLLEVVSIADVLGSQLPRSRKYEYEADTVGFDLMVAAGYNPQGMIDVFRLLQSQKGARSPEFISDHPDENNRIKKLEDKLAALKQTLPGQKRIDSVVAASSFCFAKVARP